MRRLAAIALGVLVGFSVLEGVSSLILFVGQVLPYREPLFRGHSRYDPALGWVSRPNLFVPDMYGPGIFLRTNAQGFRSDHDIAPHAPAHALRIICSGDSFTLGAGVDNDHTWCQRLAARDRRLETVNMGEDGYGIDQAYLWYVRDGRALDQAAHLFAFITRDFFRMQERSFLGHGKPVLVLENGTLVTRNVPVPELWFRWWPRVMRRLGAGVARLRSAELAQKIRERGSAGTADGESGFDPPTWAIAEHLFRDLQRGAETRENTLCLVHLPTKPDYLGAESDLWRERLSAQAASERFVYIDLIPPFRRLPRDTMKALFIREGLPGAGHYNDTGHQWVADQLYERLLHVPALATRLSRLDN